MKTSLTSNKGYVMVIITSNLNILRRNQAHWLSMSLYQVQRRGERWRRIPELHKNAIKSGKWL